MSEEQERIPSYVMLDKIDHEIFMAIQNRDVMDCVSDATDRIMALIAEALLSDDVVEATARKVVAEDPSNADTWEALSPYMQEVMVAYARSHAIAALAAAGIATVQGEGIA